MSKEISKSLIRALLNVPTTCKQALLVDGRITRSTADLSAVPGKVRVFSRRKVLIPAADLDREVIPGSIVLVGGVPCVTINILDEVRLDASVAMQVWVEEYA